MMNEKARATLKSAKRKKSKLEIGSGGGREGGRTGESWLVVRHDRLDRMLGEVEREKEGRREPVEVSSFWARKSVMGVDRARFIFFAKWADFPISRKSTAALSSCSRLETR